jgi:nucleotide-binding universal stress UspA family protein
MYSKVLVALDGSQLSESILPHARKLVEKLTLPVELLEVIDYDTLMPDNVDPKQDAMVAERKIKILEYLNNLAATFHGQSRRDCIVEVGHPEEVIVDHAAAVPDTLIAMTTHGRSGIRRWVLGSVAEKVLHASRNPLLLFRSVAPTTPPQEAALKSILVPLDGSRLAESVLPHASELCRKLDIELILVRVFNLPNLYYDESYVPDERIWELVRNEARDYLEAKVKELNSQGLRKVAAVLLEGFAEEQIIAAARERHASLIAICTHGRSGVRRFVMGSVADRVVRHSGEPVLVIRAPNTA